MSPPPLSTLVTDCFLRHLAAERNVSPHTIAAYRDALKLFLRFAADHHGRGVEQLGIDDLTASVVLAFSRRSRESPPDATVATLGSDANSLFSNGGTALMIHAAADDMKTDPAGNAGARIACGVVVK